FATMASENARHSRLRPSARNSWRTLRTGTPAGSAGVAAVRVIALAAAAARPVQSAGASGSCDGDGQVPVTLHAVTLTHRPVDERVSEGAAGRCDSGGLVLVVVVLGLLPDSIGGLAGRTQALFPGAGEEHPGPPVLAVLPLLRGDDADLL